MAESVPSLSESQKTCLRLVSRGLTSKEIALEAGWSPQTVDTYLKSAIARLGAKNRREAARILQTFELSQSLGSPTETVALGVKSAEPVVVAPGLRRRILAPPPLGGSTNELTATERTLAVLKVAAIAAAALIALTLLIAGVLRTIR